MIVVNPFNSFPFNVLPVNAGIIHAPKVFYMYLPIIFCNHKLILPFVGIDNKLTLCTHNPLHNEVPMYYKCKDKVFL